MGPGSPYRKLRVLPHLDHAFLWLDGDVLELFAESFASVMCDASEKPFAENIELTARYVEKVKGKVVVEGAVDEIFESGGQGEKNNPTTVKQAKYLSEQARRISATVGKILCIHGTSSVETADLPKLPGDGFVKINIYTTLAVRGGQALARNVLANLGNIFS